MLKMKILFSSTQNSIQETIHRKFWPESLRQRSVVYHMQLTEALGPKCPMDHFIYHILSRERIGHLQIFAEKVLQIEDSNCLQALHVHHLHQHHAQLLISLFQLSLWCRVLLFSLTGVGMLHFTLAAAMAVEGTSFKSRPSSHSMVAKVWQYSQWTNTWRGNYVPMQPSGREISQLNPTCCRGQTLVSCPDPTLSRGKGLVSQALNPWACGSVEALQLLVQNYKLISVG